MINNHKYFTSQSIDVAIVGGGMAGLSTTDLLSKAKTKLVYLMIVN